MKDLKIMPYIIIAAFFFCLFYFGWNSIVSGSSAEHIGAIISAIVFIFCVLKIIAFNKPGTTISDSKATVYAMAGVAGLIVMICFLLQVF